jgi:uncharacterized membrane protein YphA (DoxX/SURF4 family)
LEDRDQQTFKAAATTFGFAATPLGPAPLVAASALASPSVVGVPKRLERFEELRKEVGETAGTKDPGTQASEVQEALRTVRKALLSDLDRQNAAMVKAVTAASLEGDLAKGIAPEPEKGWTLLTWVDLLTMLLLTISGGCLLVGLWTRCNCVFLALFLLLTYLLFPPFPWLAAQPNTEGSYLWVNKNLIEMLALLALATTPSGRWFGLDSLIRWLWRSPETKAKAKKADADPGRDGPNGAEPNGPTPPGARAPEPLLLTSGK